MNPNEDFSDIDIVVSQQQIRVESLNNNVLQNLIVFLVNATGSKELRDDFESRLPSGEAKKQFQKFIKAIQENLDKLGFFESGDPKEIQKDLELSLVRAINREIPNPESRVELSAYRSYIPETLTVQDDKFFGSLDRDSQSILMSCAVILSALCAIDEANKNSTNNIKIYSGILKPLIKYSEQEKNPHKINKYSFNKPSPTNSVFGAFLNVTGIVSSFSYLAGNNNIGHRILSLGVALGEIACGVVGYKLKNKNFSTSLSKLMRNQTALMATTALIYSGRILSKGDFKEGEKNNLFPDSFLMAHYINLALSYALILPKNRIRDFYENVDKRFDEKFDEMMCKIRTSFLPSLKPITQEQELFWLKFLSKDKEKNEEIDSSQQSPKSSPRAQQLSKTFQAGDEIQLAR